MQKIPVRVSQLTKVYPNGVEALKGIDFEVHAGDVYALLGPNGAGKSTTIGILTSLVRKSRGSVCIQGYDIDTHFEYAKMLLGVVPQEFNFNVFQKVFDILVDQAGYYGMPRKAARAKAEYYLKALDLWDKRYAVSRYLSGGMKRRLMIIRALLHEPQILILDEPTAGVDVEIRRLIWDFLQELNASGTTIILTSHYLDEVEALCNRITIIDQGRVIETADKKELLQRLEKESFVLDIRKPCQALPFFLQDKVRILSPLNLEIEVSQSVGIGSVIADLQQAGIDVVSLRNKSNRLEELFLHMTRRDNE
jgi:ABC-2 type transport system ATP-binding protein